MTDEFEKEVIWAESTTGEMFQCVHVDFAREQEAEIKRLKKIIESNDEMIKKLLPQQLQDFEPEL